MSSYTDGVVTHFHTLMAKTVRRNYLVPADLDKAIAHLAVERGTSKSALIAQMMARFLIQEKAKAGAEVSA